MPHLNSPERVGTLRNTNRKHYANDGEELEAYGFFKKSKARVAKLNALSPEPVFGITPMMDFIQVVYDRLSDETHENDGKALFEKISSYGRSFIAIGVQAEDDEGNRVSLDGSVSQYTGYKPNNVWSGLKHSGRALTLRFVVLTVRSLSRSTESCSAR